MSETQSTKRVYRTAQTMYPLVEQWLALGEDKDLKNYCQSVNIAPHVFRYWIGRYQSAKKEEQGKGGFVALQVNQPRHQATYEVNYPNGVCLRILGSVSLSEIHSLLLC